MKQSIRENALSALDDTMIADAAAAPVEKRISAQHTLAGKLTLVMLGLWLLTMLLLTLCLAADLHRQGEDNCIAALNASISDARTNWASGAKELSVSDAAFTPVSGLPLSNKTVVQLWKGCLTVNHVGIAVHSEGFAIGSASAPNTGLTVKDGRLSFIMSPGLQNGWGPVSPYGERTPTSYHYKGVVSNGKLTFADAPQWRGSFPSAEFPGSFSEENVRFSAAAALTPGNQTPTSLLDGIDSGEYHFGSSSLLVSSYLCGTWLPDRDGAGRSFFLVAYGWSPLRTAIKNLAYLYLITLILFLLAGMLLFQTFCRTLLVPLLRLGQALKAEPLEVTDKEYDFSFRYREIQDVTAAYLLRRQIQAAQGCPVQPPENEISLPGILDRLEVKLYPYLIDRSLKLQRKDLTGGRICAPKEPTEELFLALFHEALPYAAQTQTIYLSLFEQSDFILAELSFQNKHRISHQSLSALWDGIYRQPVDENAPGARLRSAVTALPGSFCAVRKTKKGIILTVGLSKGTDTVPSHPVCDPE